MAAMWPWVAVVVSFVSCVVAQAPGDGDQLCVSDTINGMTNPFFSNPSYADNERVLMDSRNYVSLLQGDTHAWQSVDNDNNNSNTVFTNWSQPIFQACNGAVTVCGFSAGAQQNWLITQHISRVLSGGQRVRKVTVQFNVTLNGCDISRQCRQSFDVYKWQTSTINRTAARNTDNYVSVERLTPDVTSGFGSSIEYQDIELDAEDGFYLAVVDLSTCISIHRILVLYYVCPEETSQLISRPETIGGTDVVDGECVENSSTVSGSRPVLQCADRGQWNALIPCLCNPGYELDGSQDQCSECPVGTYSEGVSNGPCEACPANSEATQTGLAECPCIQDYYRAHNEGATVACTQSPSLPLSLTVSNVTNTSVVLSWLPPVRGGGRNLSEIYYTITARATSGGGVTVVVAEVTGTETNVTGLTPGTQYTFSVTAENAVSSQDTNINDRTISITNTTLDGVAGTVSTVTISGSVVSWSPPVPTNGYIRHYNIRISREDTGELVILIEEVDKLEIDVSDYDVVVGDMYTVEVQAVTSVGAGNFSAPVVVTIELEESSDSSSSPVVTVVVVVIVVLFIVLSATALLLIFYIFWYRSHVKHKHLSLFGIELPTKGRRMYVDPRTYVHVDRAVEEFASEIPPKSINLTEEIGNGEFGNVYRGLWKTGSRGHLHVAVKTLKPGSSSKLRSDFLTEASIMGQFNHPNVVKLYGVATVVEPVMIVMEYIQNGSLYYYLRKNDEMFSSTQLVNMALGVAKGMEYLSEVGFVHRDLAARNILVDKDETTKVADFGLSRVTVEDVYEVTKGGKIPVRWTAPEAIAYRKFTTRSDVWSFGVLLWEVMSYCQQPYEVWDNQTVLSKLDAGHRLQKPKDCPETVYNCMLECWNADAKKRPVFGQVVRILEILLEGNLNEGPKPKPRTKPPAGVAAGSRDTLSPLDYDSVELWLEAIKMEKYSEKFQEGGYASIQNCLELSVEELSRMGVTLAGHQNKIISSVRLGRDNFERQKSIRI